MALTKINDRSGYSVDLSNYLTGVSTTDMPSGSVIQIETFEYTGGEYSTTSTIDASTPYTATITPTRSSSKTVIMASFDLRKNSGTTNDGATVSLYRDGSLIRDRWAWVWGYHLTSSSGMFGHFAGNYADSPNSTSALTYTVRLRSYAGGSFIVGDSNSGGSLIAMEIKA